MDLKRYKTWTFVLTLILVAVGARIALIVTHFAYVPDVYYYDTQAAKALISGADPYGHNYTVPPGLATPGAGKVFAYLPGVVEFLSPFSAIGADVRFGLVLCDLLVALAIWKVGGRLARMTAAVYLLLPMNILFASWYPNNTLVGMAFLGLAVTSTARGKRWYSPLLAGLALASSQLVWLFYPYLIIADLREGRIRETCAAVSVAIAAMAPFIVWNAGAFVSNAVLFEFGRPVQSLITQEPFGVNVNPTLSGFVMTLLGAQVPLALKAVIVGGAAVPLLWRSRSVDKSLLNGSVFLLISILVLPSDYSWWYLELPLMTFMLWFVRADKLRPTRPATLKAS